MVDLCKSHEPNLLQQMTQLCAHVSPRIPSPPTMAERELPVRCLQSLGKNSGLSYISTTTNPSLGHSRKTLLLNEHPYPYPSKTSPLTILLIIMTLWSHYMNPKERFRQILKNISPRFAT